MNGELAFNASESTTVVLSDARFLECGQCGERLLDDEAMCQVDEVFAGLDRPVPITETERAELDRRLDDLEREGPVGLSWDEMLASVRRHKD